MGQSSKKKKTAARLVLVAERLGISHGNYKSVKEEPHLFFFDWASRLVRKLGSAHRLFRITNRSRSLARRQPKSRVFCEIRVPRGISDSKNFPQSLFFFPICPSLSLLSYHIIARVCADALNVAKHWKRRFSSWSWFSVEAVFYCLGQ